MDSVLANWSGLSLRLVVITLFLAYAIYIYIQRRKEYEVRVSSENPKPPAICLIWDQVDTLFSEQHGCKPILKRLPYKWPLALDVFKRQYDALIAGNLLAFQAEYFDETKVGHTFEVKLLGRVGYFTTHPKNLEAILSTNFEGKKPLGNLPFRSHQQANILVLRGIDYGLGSRRDGLFPMIGEGIFTQDGPHVKTIVSLSLPPVLALFAPHLIFVLQDLPSLPPKKPSHCTPLLFRTGNADSLVTQWKHSRELLRRQFVRIQYQDVKVFEGPINNLLATLSSSTGVVDLQPEFFRFTLATTTSLIFGEPFAGLDPLNHEVFAENFDYCSLVSAMRLRLANFCFLYSPSKFKKACGQVKRYATLYVNHALQDMDKNGEESASERHPFILDLFKELQDRILVRDQLMNVLLAGRDTTACLMSWAL
jgi:hypothetical protein